MSTETTAEVRAREAKERKSATRMLMVIFGGGVIGLIVIIVSLARTLPSGGLSPDVKPSFGGNWFPKSHPKISPP
jgi:hypothetical protein